MKIICQYIIHFADDGIACLSRIDQLGQDAQAALESVMRDQEVNESKGTATQTPSPTPA